MAANNGSIKGARTYRTAMPTYDAFDRLPRELRDALNYAAFAWAAQWVYNHWRKGKYTVPQLVSFIKKWDEAQIQKDFYTVWNREISLDELDI